MAGASSKAIHPVKSAMRTLDLIELVVARPQGVGAQEISASLAIPVSSLSYLLATLVERGYLRRDGRLYFPGDGLARLNVPAAERSLLDRARPLITALRQQFNETATLFGLVGGWQVEALFSETAGHPLRYSIEVGSRAPLHAVSSGKSILAHLSDEDLGRYFAEVSPVQFTERTIVDLARMRDEIDLTRERGWGVARDEYTFGITAIGVAFASEGQGWGAISVAAPSLRLPPDMESGIGEAIVRATELLAVR